jgi:hypothetical protein
MGRNEVHSVPSRVRHQAKDEATSEPGATASMRSQVDHGLGILSMPFSNSDLSLLRAMF